MKNTIKRDRSIQSLLLVTLFMLFSPLINAQALAIGLLLFTLNVGWILWRALSVVNMNVGDIFRQLLRRSDEYAESGNDIISFVFWVAGPMIVIGVLMTLWNIWQLWTMG